MSQYILPEKLRTFEYYKQKLPMYLQKSHGFQEHFRIWFDAMMGDENGVVNGIVPSFETALAALNIFDNSIEVRSDILDKLGFLYGVTRAFTVSYMLDGENITTQLNLDDTNFRYLILSRIIRNACEGTREQVQSFYDSIGLNIKMITSQDELARCKLYLSIFDNIEEYNNALIALFLSGNLRIESMGISYEEYAISPENILIWDSDEQSRRWDIGKWL